MKHFPKVRFSMVDGGRRGQSLCFLSPRSLQKIPEPPRGCQMIPEAPRSSQMIPEVPRGSQMLPDASRCFQMLRCFPVLPEVFISLHKLTTAFRSCQEIPEGPRSYPCLSFSLAWDADTYMYVYYIDTHIYKHTNIQKPCPDSSRPNPVVDGGCQQKQMYM